MPFPKMPTPPGSDSESASQGDVPQEPTPAAGRVLKSTGAYLEPITRFSQADLYKTEPEQLSHLLAVMTCTQQVSIFAEFKELPGKMHSLAVKVATAEDVNIKTTALRETALAALSARATEWAELDFGEYRRLLPAGFVLRGFTETYAYEFGCASCAGAGKVTCTTCDGRCRTTCSACGGSSFTQCDRCRGVGKTTCSGCNGQGSGYRTESVLEWDDVLKTNRSVQKQVYHNCTSYCTYGYLNCHPCGMTGKVRCPTCYGGGFKNCSTCDASGKNRCDRCTGSGRRHRFGCVSAKVSIQETLELQHPDDSALALMKERLTIPDLAQQTRIKAIKHEAVGARIISSYQSDIEVTHSRITAAGVEFSIFGFGPDVEVFDYQNIAGKLLELDLSALEASIAASSTWQGRGGEAVLQAVSTFAKSELNLLILESLTVKTADATAFAVTFVDKEFKGLLDQAYISRALVAFKQALSRLYQAQMLASGLYCVGIAVLSSAVAYGFGWPTRQWALPLGFGIGSVAWAAIEVGNRRRIKKLFPEKVGTRLLAQIDSSGLPGHLRWVAVALAVGASLLAMWGINNLPHERVRRAKEISALSLAASMKAWFTSGQADLRLRSYPSLGVLRDAVTSGDTVAATVLGWQLVLGAGGVPKDIPEATRLFKAAEANAPNNPLVQTGHVVALLHSDATPLERRKSLGILRQAEAGGLVEAIYWRARMQLTGEGSVRDVDAGLKAMLKAADMGHASAALEMGKRFSSGNGVRADRGKAKFYLQRAAKAGLLEPKPKV